MKKACSFRLSFIAFILATIFAGCTRQIEIDIPPGESKIVLESIFSPDAPILVSLNRTVPVNTEFLHPINNAIITLLENEIPADTLFYYKGKFHSKIIPQPEQHYSVRAVVEKTENLSANEKMPSLPNLGDCIFEGNILIDQEGTYVSQANIKIRNILPRQSFYELVLKIRYIIPEGFYNAGEEVISRVYFRNSSDPVIINEGLVDYNPGSLIFSNELFLGNYHSLTINYAVGGYVSNDGPITFDYDLIVVLRSCSENYYNYKKQLIKHLYHQQGDIWSGVGSPVQMFSNVTGGYGIFAGFIQTSDTIISVTKNHVPE